MSKLFEKGIDAGGVLGQVILTQQNLKPNFKKKDSKQPRTNNHKNNKIINNANWPNSYQSTDMGTAFGKQKRQKQVKK